MKTASLKSQIKHLHRPDWGALIYQVKKHRATLYDAWCVYRKNFPNGYKKSEFYLRFKSEQRKREQNQNLITASQLA